jgi:hypothetical protein
MLPFYRFFPALVLLAGCAGSSATPLPNGPPAETARQATVTHCPRYSKGSGILADGDFHESAEPSGYLTFSKGQRLAPNWKVTALNVNFVGTTFWNFDHLCSVDLDGESAVGGIEHHSFQTKTRAKYLLTFLMSGNSYCGSTVKKMRVTVANQSVIFKWNDANGRSVEYGKVGQRQLNFTAASSTTTLKFTSLDTAGSGCGPVIGAVAVTKV